LHKLFQYKAIYIIESNITQFIITITPLIMATQLDIVKLIEKNPITRLSQDYQSSLLNKIKDKFTGGQQQLFVSSFYCYLNHNSKNEFVIDLDDVWKWMGFSRKDPAKVVLDKNFIKDLDYKIVFQQPLENLKGGRPKEQILMNINTFKKLCLKAGTKKADEIHDYYIGLEELLQETLNEETNELREQLVIKDKIIEKTNIDNKMQIKIDKHNLLIDKFIGKKCIYIAELEENKLIKVGSTKDINGRLKQLKRVFNNNKIYFLDVFECDNYREVEESILVDQIFRDNAYKESIEGHTSKEVVLLTDNFNYEQFYIMVKKYVNQLFYLTPAQILEKERIELEKKKVDIDFFKTIIDNPNYINTINEIIKDNLPNIVANVSQLNNNTNNLEQKYNNENNKIIDLNNGKTRETQLPNYKIELNTEIKGRKTLGLRIMKIDPDNFKNIIKIYDSMIYLLRCLDNKGFQKSGIHNAIKKNRIYKGYRWMYLKMDEDPKQIIIPETNKYKNKAPIRDSILELNTEKTDILDSFSTKDILAKKLKIGKERMKRIIHNNEKYDEKYYIEYNKCPQELLNKYDKPINRVIPTHSKLIKQINPITNEFIIFNSLNEISIRFGYGSNTIINAIKSKKTYCGFLWEFYNKNTNEESIN